MTYKVIGNKTAADVLASNDVLIATGLELEEARRVAINAQKFEGYVAAWVEADSPSRVFNNQGDDDEPK